MDGFRVAACRITAAACVRLSAFLPSTFVVVFCEPRTDIFHVHVYLSRINRSFDVHSIIPTHEWNQVVLGRKAVPHPTRECNLEIHARDFGNFYFPRNLSGNSREDFQIYLRKFQSSYIFNFTK